MARPLLRPLGNRQGDTDMCLGIPGRILEVEGEDQFRSARVDFGGVRRQVCLAYVPEAEVGEYVIVHVGFAISRVDEEEAHQTLAIIQQMSDLYEQELAATEESEHGREMEGSAR